MEISVLGERIGLEIYMKEKEQAERMADENSSEKASTRNPDEIALELTKFIAMTTGYGKGAAMAGFGGKTARSSEEYADALIELFERCRAVVNK